jgi:hypothetical protein
MRLLDRLRRGCVMRRTAIIVVLLFFSAFLFAQHSGSSSSSSSSSGGGSSSHASSAPSGGGGGGGSHVSSSGGSANGGSRGSGGASGSHAASGTHASPGTSSSHSGSQTGSNASSNSRSNLRSGTTSESRPSSANGTASGPHGTQVLDEPWMHDPIKIFVGPHDAAKVSAPTAAGELEKLGLAPNAAAYRERMAAVEKAETRRPNWFARVFKAENNHTNAEAALRRPCIGKGCLPPPKPCVGKNCPPLPPPCVGKNCPPPPCNGKNCNPKPPVPWGYVHNCDHNNNCYVYLAQVDFATCAGILRRLQDMQLKASLLLAEQQRACSTDPSGTQCAIARQQYQDVSNEIQILQRQYQMCRSAARR